MTAIELLEQQHREVEQLFKDIEKLDDESDRKEELFTTIADKLAVHAAIEERHFYPTVRAEPTEDIVEGALQEHFEMKRILADLLDMEVTNEEFDEKLEELKEAVESHVEEEESDLFPKVRKLVANDVLVALAQEMTATQVELEEKGEPRRNIPMEAQQPPTLD